MTERGNYKSKNHDVILQYLQSVPGRHLTIDEIHAALSEQGHSIGVTTIYRQLNRMVDSGLISKYSIDPNTPACYEFIRVAKPDDFLNCYHLKCEQCGKLIHLQCEEIAEFTDHLHLKHGFDLNPARTVLYGLCENCRSNGKPVKKVR